MIIKFNLIQKDILNWYKIKWKENINTYPWRLGEMTPYNILVAEICLVHTTAKAVNDNDCYQKFLEKYPNISTLYKALREDLINIFKPIGLYNQKPERIMALSKYIIEKSSGEFPKTKNELKKMPMIGEYITNAILTFAYDKNEVPLDGNLKRIALNVWNIKKKKELVNLYKKLAEPNPKIIYWALFDIGWFHCRKPIPKCLECPLKKYCRNYKEELYKNSIDHRQES